MNRKKNIIIKAYKFVITHEVMYLLTNILNGIITGARPFIGIYYSRMIINSLILGDEKSIVVKYILMTIGLTMILSVLKTILDNMNQYYQGRMYRKREMSKN